MAWEQTSAGFMQAKQVWAGGVVLFGERDGSRNSFILFPDSVYFWYFMS